MKKLFVMAFALLLGAQAHAQLAVEAGYQHAFENWTVGQKKSNPLDGVYAGVSYRLGLDRMVEGLSFVPAVDLSVLYGNFFVDEWKNYEIAVDVPLQIRYSYDVASDFCLFGLFGPALEYGLVNRVKAGGNSYNLYVSDNATEYLRNRLQLYMSIGGGFEVAQTIRVQIGFDLGLLDLNPSSSWKITRHRLKVGAAWLF